VAFLELAKLEKTFPDGTRAVKGVDLAVERGEFVVLLGPSGCGKTTTLRMIAGLELPSAGSIRLDDEEVAQRRPSQRDVGFVFQFYALYPHLTVEQNLAFPLECVGTPKLERAQLVGDVAKRLGLEPLLRRRPRELSGGDQQRVALGRAMVRRPKAWLFDEPLGTLDAELRLETGEFLRQQQLASKVTTVYVTHDQEEAMRLADRVVVMSEGKVEQVGAPLEVYDEPASLFVAHFVGSPGMNFLEGELVGDGAARTFQPKGVELRIALPTAATGAALLDSASRRVVTLGVRPEFVKLAASAPLRGSVVVDEYLGASRCVHVQTPCGTIVARVAADEKARVGSNVALAFDRARVRLFDSTSGARVG
jgi:multiple sugar transport system ATP-binding protein